MLWVLVRDAGVEMGDGIDGVGGVGGRDGEGFDGVGDGGRRLGRRGRWVVSKGGRGGSPFFSWWGVGGLVGEVGWGW